MSSCSKRMSLAQSVGYDFYGCVTLGMSLTLSEPQVSYLGHGSTNYYTIRGMHVPGIQSMLNKWELLLLMPKRWLARNCQVSREKNP